MGKLDGKVAVVSGMARGQGRAHALALAGEGASIVGFDICEGFEYVDTPPSTEADLQQTVELVEALDRPCIAIKADARDGAQMEALAERAVSELGQVDILIVNHGIWGVAENSWSITDEQWEEMIDVCLTGAWKVTKAFVPRIIDAGPGGAIVLTASFNAIAAAPSWGHYGAAKHGVIGLMRTLAAELGEFNIRANAIVPGAVNTMMLQAGGTMEKVKEWRPYLLGISHNKPLAIDIGEPEDIANAALWLVSEDSRYVTGIVLNVDGGRQLGIG